jgi:adenylate cyclase
VAPWEEDRGLLYQFDGLVLDTARRELSRGAEIIPMTPQAFDLLYYLVQNRDRVVGKDELITAIWGGRIVSDAALTTRLNAARSAIGDSGEHQRLIKTLSRKGFRFVGAMREEEAPPDAATGTTAETPRPSLPLPDKASIAVLAFVNLSGDPEQEYFADGIAEDIITELSRFSELFVIARNSSFQYKGKAADVRQVGRELGVRYVLEGSVRRVGERLRISSQLVDAATGAHRWAERYDRRREDLFAVQDEVVRTIVAILAAHVRKAETQRTRGKPPTSWLAYDFYLQAADAFASFRSTYSAKDLRETQRLVQKSLAIDPTYARAYALLGSSYTSEWWFDPSGENYHNPDVLDRAHECARKAVQLDANLPEAHACLGLVLAWKREHDASVSSYERARALNPNEVDFRFGFALVLAGSSRRAIEILQAYMRLDPFHTPLATFFLGMAHFMLEEYPQALESLRYYHWRVTNPPTLMHAALAAAYAQSGLLEEAREAAAAVLRRNPNLSLVAKERTLVAFKRPEDEKLFFDALRKAGLPD